MSRVGDEVLRDIARWSALRALSVAGISDHRVVVPAVTALRTGQPLPAPFDDESGWYAVADSVTQRTYVPYLPVFAIEPDAEEPIREMSALSTLGCVAIEDALAAAVSAVTSAATTFGPDGHVPFLADLRAGFPALSTD